MSEQAVECPVEGCDFAGSHESVTQHYTATSGDDHSGGLTDFFRKFSGQDRPEESTDAGTETGPEPVVEERPGDAPAVQSGSGPDTAGDGSGPSGWAIFVATALFALVIWARVSGSGGEDQADQHTEGEQEPVQEPEQAGPGEVW